jgi:hypothetical protein
MKCPRNTKHCKACLIYKGKGKDFICSGINKKPSFYKEDKIKLCIKGEKSYRYAEMTEEEAAFIISSLSSNIATLAPATTKKIK